MVVAQVIIIQINAPGNFLLFGCDKIGLQNPKVLRADKQTRKGRVL